MIQDHQPLATRRSESFWLAAYFLSRCTASDRKPPIALKTKSWKHAYEVFFEACGDGRNIEQFRNSLKNARDTFDARFSNGRRGWRSIDQKHPADLAAIPAAIHSVWHQRSNEELISAIEDLLGRDRKSDHTLENPERLVPPEVVRLQEGEVLKPITSAIAGDTPSNRAFYRRSSDSKRIGDRAEQIVKLNLLKTLPPHMAETLVHHAAIGETPGYDISYIDGSSRIAVEVKGTTSTFMGAFEITAGEIAAARNFGSRYRVYLVADVDSETPKLQIIAGLDHRFDIEPIKFMAKLNASSTHP